MANRVCPVCGKAVPATCVLAFSDGLDCPHCQSHLDVTPGSRMVPITVGLAAGWLVWKLTSGSPGPLGWALPELYAILAFGVVSPLVLLATGTLQPAPREVLPVVSAAHPPAHH